MKIEKKEYIETCRYLLSIKKLRKKNHKFKIIKRRKSIRHKHLITGLIKNCTVDYKLLDCISPVSDYNLINPNLFINYGSSTNFLHSNLKLNLVDSRFTWLNGRLVTQRSLGSSINASWNLDKLGLVNSNARDVIYNQSYIYYPVKSNRVFSNTLCTYRSSANTYPYVTYSVCSLINYI